MFKKFFAGIVCAVFVLGSISCSSKKEEGKEADVHFKHIVAAAEEGSKTDVPTKSESADDVVAKVNGEKILRRDVDKVLDVYKQFVQPEILPKLKEQIVNELITQSLLKNFVSSQNIEVKQEEIDKGLEVVRNNLKNNPATANQSLEELLESQGQTMEHFKDTLRLQVALDQFVQKDIDDAQLQDYFQKNIDRFSEEKVTASHILIDTRQLTTQQEQDAAKEKIEHIKKEIDNGADFAEMAKQHSDCPSKENGGDLGAFPRKGAMVEPFAEAAFKLKVGEVSEPVKTEFGYHLIKVTAREGEKEITFEGAKDKVKAALKGQKTRELLKSLWDKATIEKG